MNDGTFICPSIIHNRLVLSRVTGTFICVFAIFFLLCRSPKEPVWAAQRRSAGPIPWWKSDSRNPHPPVRKWRTIPTSAGADFLNNELKKTKKQWLLKTWVKLCADFDALQCHGSTGYCWCVNIRGDEIEGTRTPPGTAPKDCDRAGINSFPWRDLQFRT